MPMVIIRTVCSVSC